MVDADGSNRRNLRLNGHDPYASLVASRTKSPLSSPPIANEDPQLHQLVNSQQQTISLLVSEKASLTAALERLEGLDESAYEPHLVSCLLTRYQSIILSLDSWKPANVPHRLSRAGRETSKSNFRRYKRRMNNSHKRVKSYRRTLSRRLVWRSFM